jgi:hypothetical protein
VSGTTDSELVFSLILNELPDIYQRHDPKVLEKAVFKAICLIIKANQGKANSINVAFTDGETIIATRYRNSAIEEPPSLYFHLGPMPGEKSWDLENAEGLAGFDRLVDHNIHNNTGGLRQRRNPAFQAILQKKIFATQSLLVSSEPLSMTGLGNWQLCPPNCMIVAHPTKPTKGRCTREELLQSLNANKPLTSEQPSAATTASETPVLQIEFRCLEGLCDTILSFKPRTGSEANMDAMTKSNDVPKRTGSLSELSTGVDVSNGIPTPPRSTTPTMSASAEKAKVVVTGKGMLGFSSLSKELARSTLQAQSRVSVDRSESDAEGMRRSFLSNSNMAPSSWHEGSSYLANR